VSDIRARLGLVISPLCENTRSTRAELAGTHNTRPTFVRSRPALHEAEKEAEAEVGCYEAEAENFGLEARLASRP